MPTRTLRLATPQPFEFGLCLRGHGWYDLPPHRLDAGDRAFATVLVLGTDAVDVELRPTATGLSLRLTAHRPLSSEDTAKAQAMVRHMLRLDDDLGAFHGLCRNEPSLQWAAQRGAGRLLRSARVFEDLVKLLFTTNTTWAGTRAMALKLVEHCGPVAPSGARGFPVPSQCRKPAAFWRDTVRCGYRAEAAVQLVEAFATGVLTDAMFTVPQPSAELWQRLVGLRGFGPYAAGQAMRLLGHYEHLALDSWCRARLAELDGRNRPPSDRAVARRYARFAPYQGLALWLHLTAAWHEPG